jgi:NAD-dependent dihydropyrimidine dehydrogenase PreA subunit
MVREIIEINEEACVGCGACIPNCHQGALQIIDGKARLISDLMCEGIGACVGHCPTGAMTIEKREAEPYDEVKVMKKLIKQGPNVVQAHIDHLAEHKQEQYLAEALEFIEDNGFKLPVSPQEEEIVKADKTEQETHTPHAQGHHGHTHGDGGCPGGCPGAAAQELRPGTSRPRQRPTVRQTTQSERQASSPNGQSSSTCCTLRRPICKVRTLCWQRTAQPTP